MIIATVQVEEGLHQQLFNNSSHKKVLEALSNKNSENLESLKPKYEERKGALDRIGECLTYGIEKEIDKEEQSSDMCFVLLCGSKGDIDKLWG